MKNNPSRIVAETDENTRNRFIAAARMNGTTARDAILSFVNQYVTGDSAYTNSPVPQDAELDDPLAGLSGDDANTIRRLIDAVHSGFPHVAMLKDLLDSHEAKATEHERKEEAPAKGKKHRKQA